MIDVQFHEPDTIDDALLRYAVIAARQDGKWLLCRHEARDTWEIPGGHREDGETVEQAARRELYEETGATEFAIVPICVYAVVRDGAPSYGMLYVAEIEERGALPPSEIAEVAAFEAMPENLTYPQIQPELLKRAGRLVGA